MKKLLDIAETDEERTALSCLVGDIRKFTSNALKGIGVLERSKNKRILERMEATELQQNLDLQKNLYASMFELFEKMHRIVDYPSFVILEDELKKKYS